jgi:5-methylcytosine-specific restriction enzyme A
MTTKQPRVYDKATWKRTRAAQLSREPRCEECLKLGLLIPATEVDHKIPVAAGGAPFDSANLQSLCKRCHSVKTRGEQTGRSRRRIKGCDIHGMPLDPRHPWNLERAAGGDDDSDKKQ